MPLSAPALFSEKFEGSGFSEFHADLHTWLTQQLQDERRQVISHLEQLHHQLMTRFHVASKMCWRGEMQGSSPPHDPMFKSWQREMQIMDTALTAVSDIATPALSMTDQTPTEAVGMVIDTTPANLMTDQAPTKPTANSMTDQAPTKPNGMVIDDEGSVDEWLDVLLRGTCSEVQRALQKGSDPNQEFTSIAYGGRTFLTGTPLAIAALRGDADITSRLLENRASVHSDYSFIAGKVEFELTLPASHAAVATASLDVLKLILDHRGDVNAKTSLDGTLLWQAAYNGHDAVVDLLLLLHADIDIPAKSQDDLTQSYTPLHAAAVYGHRYVVHRLVDEQADISGRNPLGNPPIVDAIVRGRGEIVCNLVAASANLSEKCQSDVTPMDTLFEYGNATVIANAAKGLMSARTERLETITAKDVIRFLLTPGQAPSFILQAIVRQHQVRFWDSAGNRMHVTNAQIKISNDFNIAVGPHCDFLDSSYKDKFALPKSVVTFLGNLAPLPNTSEALRGGGIKFVPGVLHMCHVAGIVENAEVLGAFLDSNASKVFEIESAKVILELHWQKHFNAIHALIVYQVVYLVIVCWINFLLIEDSASSVLTYVAGFGAVLTFFELFGTGAQIFGYEITTLRKNILRNTFLWAEQLVNLMDTCLVSVIYLQGHRCKESALFNTLFAICVYLRWMKVLHTFRGVRAVGSSILPITKAMERVGPFVGVLSVYMLGCINAYYAFALRDFWESIWVIFRITLMGDVDWEQLENVDASTRLLEDGTLETTPAAKSEYHYIVYIFGYFAAFTLGTLLMNIFIAVLSESYSTACQQAENLFLKARAEMVLDSYELSHGLSSILRFFGFNDTSNQERPSGMRRLISKSLHIMMKGRRITSEPESMSYLWYFTPREEVAL